MAIQNRRGQYADFDPSKAVPGELLTVLSGDPNAKDGKAVYMTFASGDVKRMATYEDMVDNIEAATEDVAQDVAEQIEENLQPMVQTAQTAAQTATTKANEASQSASSVSASAAQIATNKNDISDLKSAMDDVESSIESLDEQKADINGFYEDMTVGTAEAVLSESYTADSVPYHFRKTPYGDRLKEKIIGGTVAWNQLVDVLNVGGNTNGLTYTFGSNGALTISGTTNAENFKNAASIASRRGHKLLMIASPQFPEGLSFYTYYSNDRRSYYLMSGGNPDYIRFAYVSGATVNYTGHVNLFDLTQMFGSTIADYIYNLEQTTAGAGVALFRELFPKDYYEYDAGSLQSVSGLQSHDEVGFNQWDEESVAGYWDVSSGNFVVGGANWKASKNYIPCLPNTAYHAKFVGGSGSAGSLLYYDANKNYLGQYITESYFKDATFTTPINAYYMTFYTSPSYIDNGICINISDPEKNGQYEPYKKHSYPLDSSLTLRGLFKLGANNRLYVDGDRYLPSGQVQHRFNEDMLDGSENWIADSDRTGARSGIVYHRFYITKTDMYKPSAGVGYIGHILSTIPTTREGYVNDDPDTIPMSITGYTGPTSNYLYIIVNSTLNNIADVAQLKAWLASNHLPVIYELATPTTEEAQPYTNPQRCVEGGTEEYVTTGIVPVGHESEYYENIATKVDGLPYDLSMIAPIENGTTASKAYSVGQYFLHNDQFCKAKTAIASGATFTLNTNYEVTTVANELYTALH